MKINSNSTDHIGPRFICLLWAVVGLSISPNLSPNPLYYFYNIHQAAYLLPAQSAKVQGRNVFHGLFICLKSNSKWLSLIPNYYFFMLILLYMTSSIMIAFIIRLIYQLIFAIKKVQTPHLLFNDMKLYKLN